MKLRFKHFCVRIVIFSSLMLRTWQVSTNAFILRLHSLSAASHRLSNACIDDVSTELESIRVLHHLPGLMAMAMRNGQIVGQGATGYRLQGDPTPLIITDCINIGSCSKWMTATLAGRLVDRGLIKWSTTVRNIFDNYQTFNVGFHNATLAELLAHRAGIHESTTFFEVHLTEFLAQSGTPREIRRWVTETVLRDSPEVDQTSREHYSNEGYTVAATMLESVTNTDWETLIKDEVFAPLGMTSAGIKRVGSLSG